MFACGQAPLVVGALTCLDSGVDSIETDRLAVTLDVEHISKDGIADDPPGHDNRRSLFDPPALVGVAGYRDGDDLAQTVDAGRGGGYPLGMTVAVDVATRADSCDMLQSSADDES